MDEKALAIAAYLELKFLKRSWLFHIKFIGGDPTTGYLIPARALTNPRSFPRENWWFIEMTDSLGCEAKPIRVSIDEIEKIDNIR